MSSSESRCHVYSLRQSRELSKNLQPLHPKETPTMAHTDSKTARRVRESADKAAAAALAGAERVDPGLLQQMIKAATQVGSLNEQLKAAQGAAAFISAEIAEKHKMKAGDSI